MRPVNVEGLESVLLNISDLAASKRFYGELLGLPLLHEMEEGHVSVLAVGGDTALVLHHHPENAGVHPPGPEDPGATILSLMVSDLDGAVEELRASGVEVAAEPADQPWGMRTAAVLDPDGYWIALARPSA